MGSLDLQDLLDVQLQICTDTTMVPARLYPPICLVVPAILHDRPERNFLPVVQYGGLSIYVHISFASTLPSVLLHDA
jgi:hypothetical protein